MELKNRDLCSDLPVSKSDQALVSKNKTAELQQRDASPSGQKDYEAGLSVSEAPTLLNIDTDAYLRNYTLWQTLKCPDFWLLFIVMFVGPAAGPTLLSNIGKRSIHLSTLHCVMLIQEFVCPQDLLTAM